jgi:hypothetical protein
MSEITNHKLSRIIVASFCLLVEYLDKLQQKAMRYAPLISSVTCSSSRTSNTNFLKLKMPSVLAKYLWYDKIFFFEKNLEGSSININAQLNINVRLVTVKDYQKLKFPHLSANEIKNRWNLGHLCIGVEIQGKIVSLQWISFNGAYVRGLERKLVLYPNSAYSYDVYTLPEYRGLGFAPAAFGKTLSYLKANTQVEKVYMCISHTNFPSLRAAQKEELHKIGGVSYFRIFNLRFYRFEAESEAHIKEMKDLLK